MSDPYHNGDLHPGPRQGAGDALRRLSDWLGHDEDQGDEAPADEPPLQSALL